MMTAQDDYNDAVARAYANRLRVENEAILRKRKEEEELKAIEAGVVLGLIIVAMAALMGWVAKTLW